MGRYFKNVWDGVVTVLIGMKVTWMHLFTRAVTIQYPDVKVKLPERARNRLYVNMDDCIGCDQCAMACPVDCITIETIKSTPDVDLGFTSVGTKKRVVDEDGDPIILQTHVRVDFYDFDGNLVLDGGDLD